MTNTTDKWVWTDRTAPVRNPDYVAPAPVDHMALLRQCGEALARLIDEYVSNVDTKRTGGFYENPEEEECVITARAALEALRKAGVA